MVQAGGARWGDWRPKSSRRVSARAPFLQSPAKAGHEIAGDGPIAPARAPLPRAAERKGTGAVAGAAVDRSRAAEQTPG